MREEKRTQGPRTENRRQQGQNVEERRRQRQAAEDKRQRGERELTPQERHRLQQLRTARRRQRRRARIRRLLLVASLLILLVILIPRLIRWGYDGARGAYQKITALWEGEETKDPLSVSDAVAAGAANNGQNGQPQAVFSFGKVEREVMEQLKDRYEGDKQAQVILDHPEQYPDELLTLLSKRSETLEFVLKYPEKKTETAPQVDLSGEIKKGVIPRLYQWDLRWGYGSYGDNIIALAGCGPTCLSMVMLGLTGDDQWDPFRVAKFSEEEGYVSEVGTAWDLMTLGAEKLGIASQVLPLDENRMIRELEAGHPIICSMRPGDFTDTGHFIVLVEYRNGGFVVHDPNSIGNSDKTWNYEEIRGQIRNLWAFSSE